MTTEPLDFAEYQRKKEPFKADAPKDQPPLRLVYFEDIEPCLETADFVEGLLTTGGLSVVYGKPGCGKSFSATDLSLRLALGWPVHGRDVIKGGVVYVYLEGAEAMINNRIAAFKKHHGPFPTPIPFAHIPTSLDLRSAKTDTNRLIAAIKEAAEKFAVPVSMIVIDTLSRALAGGNECLSEDMGALLTNVDLIRQTTSVHVMLIHHCGKDEARGQRGWSGSQGWIDTEIEIVRDKETKISKATMTKQRDLEQPDGPAFSFTLSPIELGRDTKRGKPVYSCVVETTENEQTKKSTKVPKAAKVAFNLLKTAIDDCGQLPPSNSHTPPGIRAVEVETWRKYFYEGAISDGAATKRQAFNRASKRLQDDGLIATWNDWVWPTTR